MSDSLPHNKYRYDFVSQPPQNRTCAAKRIRLKQTLYRSDQPFCYLWSLATVDCWWQTRWTSRMFRGSSRAGLVGSRMR